MVATRSNGKLEHARFNELPRFLRAGDLVVVNTSAQIPAAVAATRPDGTALELRLSTPMPDGRWLAELRLGAERFTGGEDGERLALPDGAHAELVVRYADSRRLWVTELAPAEAARPLPRRARPADPLRLRLGAVAARRVPERLRARARQRRAAERRPPVHARADDAARREGRPRRADRAAHRRLLAGARRAARTPSGTACPSTTARARQRRARLGRPRRSRSERRSRARSKRLPRRTARSRPARVGRRS